MNKQERQKVISGGTWMDAERAAAEKAYRLAVAASTVAAEADEETWLSVTALEDEARKELVRLELLYPTAEEYKRQSRKLYLANRGVRD